MTGGFGDNLHFKSRLELGAGETVQVIQPVSCIGSTTCSFFVEDCGC